jgi:hypothetical protein
VLFDGLNLFEPARVKEKGIEYHGIRRESPSRFSVKRLAKHDPSLNGVVSVEWL